MTHTLTWESIPELKTFKPMVKPMEAGNSIAAAQPTAADLEHRMQMEVQNFEQALKLNLADDLVNLLVAQKSQILDTVNKAVDLPLLGERTERALFSLVFDMIVLALRQIKI